VLVVYTARPVGAQLSLAGYCAYSVSLGTHFIIVTMPRSLLALPTVMPSRKQNVSEQCSTVQHSRITVTRISFMESLCVNLFSFGFVNIPI
jgi:hypothetical protein